jgi:hypothetical protein
MKKLTMNVNKKISKYGKTTFNDFSANERFFAEMKTCLRQLDEVPFSAVEDLKNYDLNRDIIVEIIRKCFLILDAANVDVVDEIDRMEADPYDGFEEDTEIRRSQQIKIAGE